MLNRSFPRIDAIEISTYRIPTDEPESDGTIKWNHTDLITAHVSAGGKTGLGWTYAARGASVIAADILKPAVQGCSAFCIEQVWQIMNHQLRNAGKPGAGMMAVSAIDTALWDLKAKLLDISLVDLLGAVRDVAPIYGSGGFTSYSDAKLAEQLGGWAAMGIERVKMKVGRDAQADPHRVRTARQAIGEHAELFVDANGGYSRKQALAMAQLFADEFDVKWFEEPVSSDDLIGLRLLRDRAPAGMDIAAGEYGDMAIYFRSMLEAEVVDCLQADATRCGGYTGFLKVGALCEAFQIPLSAHCAPQLHAHIGCAVQPLRHLEYFHDHVRIARMLFDGALEPLKGMLKPDCTRPGHGITLKTADAERFRI